MEDAYSLYEKYLEDNIRLIKTTGQEESDAAYTRNIIIYIPLSMIQWPYNELKELIAHELFHVVSSNNPDMRNSLYAKLGFYKCPELEVPEAYRKLYVTNPDTIGKNCYVKVQNNGNRVRAVPFLYSELPYKVHIRNAISHGFKAGIVYFEGKGVRVRDFNSKGKLTFEYYYTFEELYDSYYMLLIFLMEFELMALMLSLHRVIRELNIKFNKRFICSICGHERVVFVHPERINIVCDECKTRHHIIDNNVPNLN